MSVMDLYLSAVVSCAVFLFMMPQASPASASSAAKRNLQILLTTRACQNCDLSGLDMTRLDLSRTDLQGADLSLALCNLTNLSHANLRGAILHGTKMVGADLEGADLRDADLRGTSLESAFLGDVLVDRTLGNEQVLLSQISQIPSARERYDRREKPSPAIQRKVYAKTDPRSPQIIRATQSKKVARAGGKPVPKITTLAGFSPALKEAEREHGSSSGLLQILAEKKKRKRGLEEDGERKVIRALLVKKKIMPLASSRLASTQSPSSIVGRKMAKDEELPEKAAGGSVSTVGMAKQIPSLPTMHQSSSGKTAPTTPPPVLQHKRRLYEEEGEGLHLPTGTKQKTGAMLSGNRLSSMREKARQEKEFAEKTTSLPSVAVMNGLKQTQLQRLLKTKKCYGCDLAGLNLSGQTLVGADLERADLRGCDLRKTDLRNANLKAARLQNAQLQKAKLDGADFYKASLIHANLSGASVIDTDFSGAQLEGVVGLQQKGAAR